MITTEEQRQAFDQDGYVIISGLLSDDELENLVDGGEKILHGHEAAMAAGGKKTNPFFTTIEKGTVLGGPTTSMDADDSAAVTKAFRDVAIRSKIPMVASELMGIAHVDVDTSMATARSNTTTTTTTTNTTSNSKNNNVRLLRDVFLGKGLDDPKACQWHVDDPSFWPESYQSTGGAGVNAWIAMADMPYGGSMGLARGSHKADWRVRGYEALGQDHSRMGYTKDELVEMLGKGAASTCSLDSTDPELYETIEATSDFPKLQKGDVIFHTRMLFHKTVALSEESKEAYRAAGVSTLNRYSLRYVSGQARLPTGFVNELSYFMDNNNAGKTLDDIVADSEVPWYPQVYPEAENDFEKVMESKQHIVGTAKDIALQITMEFIKLIHPPPKTEEANVQKTE